MNYLVYSTVLQQLQDGCSGHESRHHPIVASDDPPAPYNSNTAPPSEEMLDWVDVSGAGRSRPAQPPLSHVAIAAAAAGFALSFILSPTELVKCRMQVR